MSELCVKSSYPQIVHSNLLKNKKRLSTDGSLYY